MPLSTNDLSDPKFSAIAVGGFQIKTRAPVVLERDCGFAPRIPREVSGAFKPHGSWGEAVGIRTPLGLAPVSLVLARASSICHQLQLVPVLLLILFERVSFQVLTSLQYFLFGWEQPTLFVASPLRDCLCV